jgi:hypothetical protein
MVLLIVDLLAILFYSFKGGKNTSNLAISLTEWGEPTYEIGKNQEYSKALHHRFRSANSYRHCEPPTRCNIFTLLWGRGNLPIKKRDDR